MAEVKKITKTEYFGMIKDAISDAEVENKQEILDFIDAQVALIASKAEKAKARAAEKKTEGDALRETVQSILTDELQTVDEIFSQIEGEDLTKAKIVARLTQLVKAEVAVKEQVKVDSKKVMAYRLA